MTVEKNPSFFCYYYNEEDKRSCICGNDKCKFGRPACAPNLATTTGKVLLLLYLILPTFVVCLYLFFRTDLFK